MVQEPLKGDLMEKILCWLDIKAAAAVVILAEAKKSELINLHQVTDELKKLAKAGFKFWNRYDLYGNFTLEPEDSPDLPFLDSVYGWVSELISRGQADFNGQLILKAGAEKELNDYIHWRLWTYAGDSPMRLVMQDLMRIHGLALVWPWLG